MKCCDFFGFGSTFINGSSSGWWLEMLSIVDLIVFSEGLTQLSWVGQLTSCARHASSSWRETAYRCLRRKIMEGRDTRFECTIKSESWNKEDILAALMVLSGE